MSDKTVIVGPKPTGADTGVAVGFHSLIQALEARGLEYVLVNSVIGGVPNQPGKPSIRRAMGSLLVGFNACVALVGAKRLYMTLSTSMGGFLRGAIIVLWASFLHRRIVLHLKGGGFRDFYDGQGKVMQRIIRQVMRRSDRIIALGELLVEQFSVVPGYEERVVVIPNGFPANMEVPESKDRTLARGQSLRVLYLSNLVPSKGLIYMMDAVLALVEEGVDIQLEIAGSLKDVANGQNEDFKKFLEDFKEKLESLGERACFHGTVYGEQKEALFRNSDLFCLPTFYPWEGQPISIIEALAYGLPVIATPHKGIPEEVIDGKNGFLVEPKSSSAIMTAMNAFDQDHELYESFSVAARKHFDENFTREVHQERLIRCILGET